jgi:hypothetical protein
MPCSNGEFCRNSLNANNSSKSFIIEALPVSFASIQVVSLVVRGVSWSQDWHTNGAGLTLTIGAGFRTRPCRLDSFSFLIEFCAIFAQWFAASSLLPITCRDLAPRSAGSIIVMVSFLD